MKGLKITHWIFTVLLSVLMLFSASMYLTQYEMVQGFFIGFGFPTWIIYPLAIAKILGVIVIIWKPVPWLTHWAFAGFFFDTVLAIGAHVSIEDGGQMMSVMGLIFTIVSVSTWLLIQKAKS